MCPSATFIRVEWAERDVRPGWEHGLGEGWSCRAPDRPIQTRQEVRTVSENSERQRAERPEELGRFFVERANAGDLEGLVALYEPSAVLAVPGGGPAAGADAIRQALGRFLEGSPKLSGDSQPALRFGDLALTSTRFDGGATAEVARRQPDGTWLWVIDQPRIFG
jgi:ketosteroid isomerase-like protein